MTPGLLVGSARVDGENRSDTFLMQKARVKFDLAFQGNSPEAFETVQDGDFYERGLTLQPGRNEMNIKCYGARMAAPGDPRFIVFGIKDWSVTPR